jgi:TPR repeat protein
LADITLLFLQGDAAEEAGDFALAHDRFAQCAALGDEAGWTRLGYLFDVGLGVPVDKAEAMRCYRKAWRKRSTVAANNIAILYRERGNRRAMFRWFERAALEGDGSAHFNLAKCYLNGTGVRRSLEAAQRRLVIAASHADLYEDERDEAEELLAELRPRLVGLSSPSSGGT